MDSYIFRAQGKVQSALNYLSHDQAGGVLGLDDIIPQSNGLTTRDIFLKINIQLANQHALRP